MLWQGLTLLAILASMAGKKATEKMDTRSKARRDVNRALIRVEARLQGVPQEVALAFARIESDFNELAEGDKNWHLNRARFERNVPSSSPYKNTPELWHSYGLFQLNAAHHVQGDESPRALLDARTNIARGVATIKRLLDRFDGDVAKARLAYTGSTTASAEHRANVLRKLDQALRAERAELTKGVT